MATNSNFRDLLHALNTANAKYLLIGAYAVSYYSEPRYTKDFDLWIASDVANVERIWNALANFGAPLDQITKEDLRNPQAIYQIGVAPNRFDILVQPGNLSFDDAWKRRVESNYDGEKLPIVAREDLIKLKEFSGRPQDLLDIQSLKINRTK